MSSVRAPRPVRMAAGVTAAALLFTVPAIRGLAAPLAAASPHPEITPANVARLSLAFSFRTDRVGAESGAPATMGGVLFMLTPFPHTLFAIDTAGPPQPRIKWQFTPPADRTADGLACCDLGQHGPVVVGDAVYFTTLDGHVVCLAAADGQLRFDVRVADLAQGETLAGPPTPAAGRVLVGNAGDDFGARGWLAALDAHTGQTVWKAYSTGPDNETGTGAGFVPPDPADRARDRGVSSWPSGAWRQGGGSVATPVLADEQAGWVFHGTGHAAPWNAEPRPGANRWTGGLFARDAASGAARWFQAFDAGSPYAYRASAADLLVDGPWQGRTRRLLVHPDANGTLAVLDRGSGEVLAADPVVQTVVSGQVSSGVWHGSLQKTPQTARQTRGVCPSWLGAVNGAAWASGGPLVMSLDRLCMDIEPRPANYIAGTPYTGANVRLRLPAGPAGSVVGWDLAARRLIWRVDERLPVWGGVLLAGGLVFYGTLDGQLNALDARSGQRLWQARVPAGIIGTPVAFRGADGRAGIAVVAGTSRLRGLSRREALDPRDAIAGFGLSGLMEALPDDADPAGTLLVFQLP